MENDDGVWNCLPEDGFDEDPFLATLSNICPDGLVGFFFTRCA